MYTYTYIYIYIYITRIHVHKHTHTGCVTKCAPHLALTLIARGKLTFDERVVLHRGEP